MIEGGRGGEGGTITTTLFGVFALLLSLAGGSFDRLFYLCMKCLDAIKQLPQTAAAAAVYVCMYNQRQ